MKKILFDLRKIQPIGNTKFHGGGVYGKVVFERLAQLVPEKLVAYYNPKLFLYPSVLSLINEKNIEVIYSDKRGIMETADQFDYVIYSPLISSEYLINNRVTIIVTLHGIRDIECPTDKYRYWYNDIYTTPMRRFLYNFGVDKLKRYYDNKIKVKKVYQDYLRKFNAPNIHWITVSNHSKYLMMSFIPSLRDKKIPVMYSCDTAIGILSTEKITEYGKYYLMVSANRWIKNTIRGIMAFDQLFSEIPDMEGKVVLTGAKDSSFSTYKIKNRERFVFEGYVDEERLKALYRNAFLFFYPSLYEGFGYPPLEAMHQECPVACSYAAAMPEICGDAALYFNPYSIPEMKARILQMENDEIREEFRKKGVIRQHFIAQKQDFDLQMLCEYIISFIDRSK